jgi:hypothetical protein
MSESLNTAIKFLSTTVGRDKICKLVQYIAIYFLNSNNTNKVGFQSLYHNMWITRKLLRFGLLWHYLKQIKTYTDPNDNIDEQGDEKSKKTVKRGALVNSSKEDKVVPPPTNIMDFDVPALKALSII